MESKTGIKTIDKLNEIPVVSSAYSNMSDYYGKVKEKNLLLRTSCNLAEMSLKTMAFAAQPITTLCKKPIESVDSFLSDKVESLEYSYPAITKPTNELTAQAKDILDRTVKQPIETLNTIKERTVGDLKSYGTNKMESLVIAGADQLVRTVDLGFRMVDLCTENKYAKMITDPVLNLTEKSLKYFIPNLELHSNLPSQFGEHENSTTTLKRLCNINSSLYRHFYHSTFNQLTKLHFQFENTIGKLQSLKRITDSLLLDSKIKLSKLMNSVSESSLVSRCAQFIDKNDISMNKLETFSKDYFAVILAEFSQTLEKYLALVKNFPVTFEGTKLKQTVDNVITQLNKESFGPYLQTSIDTLKSIHEALLSYTSQMFHVVNESKVMQMLKRIQSRFMPSPKQQQQQQQEKRTKPLSEIPSRNRSFEIGLEDKEDLLNYAPKLSTPPEPTSTPIKTKMNFSLASEIAANEHSFNERSDAHLDHLNNLINDQSKINLMLIEKEENKSAQKKEELDVENRDEENLDLVEESANNSGLNIPPYAGNNSTDTEITEENSDTASTSLSN